MQPSRGVIRKTAIPPRFEAQRNRVLGILARWEAGTLARASRLAPARVTPRAR